VDHRDDHSTEGPAPAETETLTPGSPGRLRAPSGPPVLPPGATVAGRYRIVRFIARGGMGEVYEVLDSTLDQAVALKVLRPDLAADPVALERLKREVLLARQVTHHNVCRIFDLVIHRGRQPDGTVQVFAGVTMELLAGETLAERLGRTGAMSPDEALPLVRQMASALAAAHAAGVVHRDFKCGNVMVLPPATGEAEPRLVVTDFGVARGLPREEPPASSLTGTDVVLGTVDYMSPEQAQGGPVTQAADIYALGVVLFEMVTGVRPHRGQTAIAVLLSRLKDLPPSPRAVAPHLDPTWESVILRCLARDPAERFHRVEDVVAALEGRARAAPPRSRAGTRISRSTLRLAALLFALAGLAAVAAWWSALDRNRPRRAAVPVSVQLTTWPGLEVDPSLSPDGDAVAFASNRTGRFEVYVQQLQPGSRALQITQDGQQSFQPVWSPDGTTIAFASHGRGGIWLVPARGGSPRQLTSFGSHPAWSPDGRTLAFQSDATAELSANAVAALPPSTLWLMALDEGEPRQLTRVAEPPGGHGAPSWTPDGRFLVFTASDRQSSTVFRVGADGKGLERLVTEAVECFDPQLGPDGRSLYYSAISEGERYGLWRLALSRTLEPVGSPVAIATLGQASVRQFTLSRDGRRLVHSALATTSNLWAVDVDAAGPGPAPRPLTTGSARNSRPAFSPDGRSLAFVRWQVGASQDIWVLSLPGGEASQLTSNPATDSQPGWMPGGNEVVFASDRLGGQSFWAVDRISGRERLLGPLSSDADAVRLSPDGTRIAYHAPGPEGTLNVWTASVDGSRPRQITDDPELAGFPSWSPDGQRIALEVRRGENDHAAVVGPKGGEPQLLSAAGQKSWPNSWSPDGDRIACATLRDGRWEISWVSLATREERTVTRFDDLAGYVRYPAWSPDGGTIVFERAVTTGDLWLLEGLE